MLDLSAQSTTVPKAQNEANGGVEPQRRLIAVVRLTALSVPTKCCCGWQQL
jgi:hypothetical protein